MSKKNTLNEVRRFMKLANLDAGLSSNFVTKLEEMDQAYTRDDEEMDEGMHDAAYQRDDEEEDAEMELDAELDAEDDMEAEDDMDMEMDMDLEDDEEEADEADEAVLTDDEADAIIALADKLRAAREEGDDDMDMDMDMEEETLEEDYDDKEETLEEILQDVLGEGAHEDEEIEEGMHDKDDKKDKDEKLADTDTEKDFFAGKSKEDINLANLQKRAKKEKEAKPDGDRGDRAKNRMRSRDRDATRGYIREEDLVQEVLKRVKVRLSEMSKSKE